MSLVRLRGVFKTTDGGKTWNKILFVNETTGCSELIMDPTNPEVLYAAFWEFRRTAYSFNSGGLKTERVFQVPRLAVVLSVETM